MSLAYRTVKLFDLSHAPPALRQHEEIALAFPPGGAGPSLLAVEVGAFAFPGSAADGREGSQAESELHRWLVEAGAERDESVLVQWDRRL